MRIEEAGGSERKQIQQAVRKQAEAGGSKEIRHLKQKQAEGWRKQAEARRKAAEAGRSPPPRPPSARSARVRRAPRVAGTMPERGEQQ